MRYEWMDEISRTAPLPVWRLRLASAPQYCGKADHCEGGQTWQQCYVGSNTIMLAEVGRRSAVQVGQHNDTKA